MPARQGRKLAPGGFVPAARLLSWQHCPHETVHRPAKLSILLAALLLAAGCAGPQLKESAQTTTAEILVTTLALVADHDAEDKRREYEPGEWTYCDIGCEFQRHLSRERERAAAKHRDRRRQSEVLQADFDAFMHET